MITLGTLGFVGIGAMGQHMIKHIKESANNFLLYDINPEAAQAAAVQVSATAVTSLADFESTDVVILMLPNSDIIDEVVHGKDGLLQYMKPGSLIVDMSSSVPGNTIKNFEMAKAKGIAFIDAPVSGGVKGAKDGTLAIMAGGQDADYNRALPLLECMGGKVVHVGNVGAGHALKALNNLLAATTLLATAEVFAVGKKFGLDPDIMQEVIDSSSGSSFQTSKVWQHVTSGKYDFGFAAALMLKDVRIALSLVDDVKADVDIARVILDQWEKGVAQTESGADMTELAKQIYTKNSTQ